MLWLCNNMQQVCDSHLSNALSCLLSFTGSDWNRGTVGQHCSYSLCLLPHQQHSCSAPAPSPGMGVFCYILKLHTVEIERQRRQGYQGRLNQTYRPEMWLYIMFFWAHLLCVAFIMWHCNQRFWYIDSTCCSFALRTGALHGLANSYGSKIKMKILFIFDIS